MPRVQPAAQSFRIGVVIPLQGPGGIFGPSCISVCEMAKDEINRDDGVAGRQAELVYIDGGQSPQRVAEEVARLIEDDLIDAVTGWHISSIRRLLAPIVSGRVPYVYTSLFEGGEHAPGVYCSGETPEQQVFPAMQWLRRNLGIRRWHVVGARYVWPVRSMEKTIQSASTMDVEIVGSTFVDMGSGADPLLPLDVAVSGCDGVLMLLVGQDAVAFNRSFADAGLHRRITRYSPLMDENMLLASGAEATENLYCSASYFNSLTSADALDFLSRYVSAGGPAAPALNNMAQSCYQGIQTLVRLSQRADSLTVAAFDDVIDGLVLEGPRGIVRYHGNQAVQSVNLARADAFDFEVIQTL
ncbi:substrate-binding domain-containing protein [Gordonia sp. PDNC005]|uniref:substrate-binding domain-containing protein n=1 Tax=unclassified Gordonia (in: high G+C Gram-positive bacteria) TaxID=2657482 RepID=UPI001965C653|nr:substrate-binding domain-containing protein [Gordonia sp. PDNC005]QRY63035.1 substrate-binding domain-containing protein [Gordonia sp. PDNC005]